MERRNLKRGRRMISTLVADFRYENEIFRNFFNFREWIFRFHAGKPVAIPC